MKVIKLTDTDGKVCLINIERVEYIYIDEKFTKVEFKDNWIGVRETPEEIYDKLYPIIVEL